MIQIQQAGWLAGDWLARIGILRVVIAELAVIPVPENPICVDSHKEVINNLLGISLTLSSNVK